MNKGFEDIKSLDNTQHYFQKNKIFTFCVSISLILHIFLLLIITYSNKPCTDCKENIQDEINRPQIKSYILKKPPREIIPEEEKIETTTIAGVSELKAIPEPKQKAAINKPIQATSQALKGKLDYTTLRSSINNVLEQDTQAIKEAIFDDCETVKKKTGALDCVSNIERLGYKKNDPYHLSKIFKSLDKNPDNKKKERVLAKLRLNESYIKTVIDSSQLPTLMRQQFKEEIAYIRGEIHYQDCDGKPNSGTCAGEVDLGKIGKLLDLLFSN
jgi:hypothetical protein